VRFFVPGANDQLEAEDTYQAVAKFTAENSGPIRDQRYYAIYYRHEGRELVAKVGEPEALTGETVIAILRTDRENGPFLICTPNRGAGRGSPVFANGGPHTRAHPFEDY